jgi:hypothetical protein
MALEWEVPNLACAYTYIDENGKEQTEQIRPEGEVNYEELLGTQNFNPY